MGGLYLTLWGGAKVFSAPNNNGRGSKLSRKVLVLNNNYEPLSICNVKKAICLLYLEKAELVAASDGRLLRSVSMSMPLPSIVRLAVFVRVPFKRIVLSRKNVLRRDGHRCQYCGRNDVPLTVDHVIPKARGGDESWENLVAACVRCNNRKGDRTPVEALMHLHRRPIRPNHVMFLRDFAGDVDEQWKPYLFMN